jgi:hypothetical protein
MTVIEMQPERFGIELVDVATAGMHRLERSIHVRWVHSMEVDAVRVAALVHEAHANTIAFGTANRGTRHLAVVRPCRVKHTGRNLDFPVFGNQLVLTKSLTRGKPGNPARIEVRQEIGWVKGSGRYIPHRHHVVMGCLPLSPTGLRLPEARQCEHAAGCSQSDGA